MVTPLVLGHRGAPGSAPENSLDSFRAALDQGADGVELDVRRSRDGALVLHHDAALVDGRLVGETPRAQLPANVPLLEEALEVCAGAVVNVELKNIPGEPDFDAACGLADAVVDLLGARRGADQVIVSCFHLATIDRVKARSPRVRTGLLTLFDPPAAAGVELAVSRGHDAVHPHHAFVDAGLVRAATARGLEVNTWTVDEPDRIRELARLGVHGVVTNLPEVAVASLHPDGDFVD